jgi:hypothetical protein
MASVGDIGDDALVRSEAPLEIVHYGATSLQVARRLRPVYEDLLEVVSLLAGCQLPADLDVPAGGPGLAYVRLRRRMKGWPPVGPNQARLARTAVP